MTAVSAAGPLSPVDSSRQVLLRRLAIGYGIAVVFINNMPMMDHTLPGRLVEFLLAVVAFGLVFFGFRHIVRALLPGELLVWIIYFVITLIASIAGSFQEVNSEPAILIKLILLNGAIYLSAKLIDTEDGIERYIRWFYYLCLFAAAQAILAALADVAGVRQLHAIPISQMVDGRYMLGWWGLLGGDTLNFRTNFYFSEPSFFAQMLLPGIAYAFSRRRWMGLVILLGGLATTFAGVAALALGVALFLFVLRFGVNIVTATIGAIAGIAGIFVAKVITAHPMATIVLFARGTSVNDKVVALHFTFDHLQRYPFGIGPVDLPTRYGTQINTGLGLFEAAAQLGFLGLVFYVGLAAWAIYLIFNPRSNRSVVSLAIGIFAVLISGATHGPFLKYFLVFMISVVVSYSNKLAAAQRPPVRDLPAGEPA